MAFKVHGALSDNAEFPLNCSVIVAETLGGALSFPLLHLKGPESTFLPPLPSSNLAAFEHQKVSDWLESSALSRLSV